MSDCPRFIQQLVGDIARSMADEEGDTIECVQYETCEPDAPGAQTLLSTGMVPPFLSEDLAAEIRVRVVRRLEFYPGGAN